MEKLISLCISVCLLFEESVCLCQNATMKTFEYRAYSAISNDLETFETDLKVIQNQTSPTRASCVLTCCYQDIVNAVSFREESLLCSCLNINVDYELQSGSVDAVEWNTVFLLHRKTSTDRARCSDSTEMFSDKRQSDERPIEVKVTDAWTSTRSEQDEDNTESNSESSEPETEDT